MKHISLNNLNKILGINRVKINFSLFPYFSIRTNCVAEFFFEAKTKHDLLRAIVTASKNNLTLTFIGGGSNLVVTKDVLAGLVVKNSYLKKEILREGKQYVEILVSSGYSMSKFVQETVDAGYEGFEYHKGLPGTIGGALCMNSKWTKPLIYIGDLLSYAYLSDATGKVRKADKEYFNFSYDYSILQETKEIVLDAVFKLNKVEPKILKTRSEEAFKYRKDTQPFGVSSSGCFFKNISDKDRQRLSLSTNSAGYLIDKAGLKKAQVGAFFVSNKHANFIINQGKGDPNDLVTLLNRIKSTVKAKYGVQLKEEVIII